MIRAVGLRLFRGGRPILDGIDVEVTPGRLRAVVGPNGAGKSTLLAILTGSLRPSAGKVTIDSDDLARVPVDALARRRAVLHQRFDVALDFTVREVVRLGRSPHLHRGLSNEDRAIADRALEEVGLSGFGGRWYRALSGGEQQRVHFARVLAQLDGDDPRSRYLFLDEPTASLDARHAHELLTTVRKKVELGLGAFVVVHDMNLALRYADDVTILENGRVAFEGSPDEGLSEARTEAIFGVKVHRAVGPDGVPWMAVLGAGD